MTHDEQDKITLEVIDITGGDDAITAMAGWRVSQQIVQSLQRIRGSPRPGSIIDLPEK